MDLAHHDLPIIREGQTAVLLLHSLGNEFAWATLQLAEDLNAQGVKHLVVDCLNASCFDCAAMGRLLKLTRALATHQGHVILCGLSTLQLEILRLIKLHRRWHTFDSRAEALHAIVQATGRMPTGQRS